MLSFMVSESESEVAQSCPTLCDPMDCSPPGSSVHGIFQARLLEWVAISFSSRSSQPRDRTRVSHTAGRRFTNYILIREYLPTLKSWGYFLHLQNILFLFSLTFKPTIHLKLIFAYVIGNKFLHFPYEYPNDPKPYTNHLCTTEPFFIIKICESVSGLHRQSTNLMVSPYANAPCFINIK